MAEPSVDVEQLTCEHDGVEIPLWEVEWRHGDEALTAEDAVRQALAFIRDPQPCAGFTFRVRPILADELEMLSHEREFTVFVIGDEVRVIPEDRDDG